MSATQHRLFVRVAPGLEQWLDDELRELGLHGKAVSGGVELRASTTQLWLIHHNCRLCESVRVRLRSFQARTFDELVEGLKRLPWHAYLNRELEVEVSVTCHRSRLWHSDAVAERVRGVISKFVANPGMASGGMTQTLFVRITGDIVQASIDATGELMHRRGHRVHVGAAPLRETLAAALVRILEPRRIDSITLWDPFCGSGCLMFEWLEAKFGCASGRDRQFVFEKWPTHDSVAYRQWLDSQEPRERGSFMAFGSDVDSKIIASAGSNAEAHRLEPQCKWLCGDFESFVDEIPTGTCILSNPPYGHRLGNKGAYAQVMQRLERVLARRHDLRPAVVLVPSPCTPWKPSLNWQTIARFYNGGLRVQAMRLPAMKETPA